MKKKTTKQKQIDTLDSWEWTTLVASWRYFEYGATIASAQFPCDIIERFWRSGKYSDKCLSQIARQFAKTDHGIRREDDWTHGSGRYTHDCDKQSWCKFFAFCEAWCDGFATLTIDNGNGNREVREAFKCEFTGNWHPKEPYIANPYVEWYIPDEFIKKQEVAK